MLYLGLSEETGDCHQRKGNSWEGVQIWVGKTISLSFHLSILFSVLPFLPPSLYTRLEGPHMSPIHSGASDPGGASCGQGGMQLWSSNRLGPDRGLGVGLHGNFLEERGKHRRPEAAWSEGSVQGRERAGRKVRCCVLGIASPSSPTTL